MNAVFIHVRQGFEAEAFEELSEAIRPFTDTLGKAPAAGKYDPPHGGFITIELPMPATPDMRMSVNFDSLIFARQLLWVFDKVNLPATGDRVTPIMSSIQSKLLPMAGANAFSALSIETPDTDSSKELSRFCRALTQPLENALNKARLLPKGKGAAHLPRIHIVMLSGTHILVALSDVDNSSPWPMGIPRLKFPPGAPSRSTLKLEEAFHVFLGRDGTEKLLTPNMTAVDLGACPGGWTYQFVKRNIRTTAIDNGAIDPSLMKTGLVTHLTEDAFKYRPDRPVDWLVCDVVEQPARITDLMASWLVKRHCRHAIFNLKLPMKRRFEEVSNCLKHLREACASGGLTLQLKAKQLYHDRKEITVFASRV